METIIERECGAETLPWDVFEDILARADGVPLFVEELTRTMLEAGWLRDGDSTSAGRASPLAVPATLRDALVARLQANAGLTFDVR